MLLLLMMLLPMMLLPIPHLETWKMRSLRN